MRRPRQISQLETTLEVMAIADRASSHLRGGRAVKWAQVCPSVRELEDQILATVDLSRVPLVDPAHLPALAEVRDRYHYTTGADRKLAREASL